MNLPENYIVIPRKVKHVRMRVSEDLKVRIIVPMDMDEEGLVQLVKKREAWIEKHLSFFKNRERIKLQFNEILLYGNRYTYYYDTQYVNRIVINEEYHTIRTRRNLTDEKIQEKWLKTVAKKYLEERIIKLSETLSLPFNKLYLRTSRNKWGNCSSEKNISINWRLVKAPKFVIDYVIVHELVHTLVMNHSTKFYTLLRSHYPDYEKAQAWLDKFGVSL